MRSFRSRLSDTRLAVTLAMQPFAKRSRAWAMSTDGVRTGTPTASMERTDEVVMLRIRSRSWIIRSSTTSTSVPRSVKGARRWHSMKRGRATMPSRTRMAGLKRSRCPTCSTRPRRAASSTSAFPSASVVVSGFSTSTSIPASSRSRDTAWWCWVGTATLAQSMRPMSARWSVSASAPSVAATSRARAASTSATATSVAPGCVAYFSAWKRPR